MDKKLKNYINKIDDILNNSKIKNKEELLQDHLTQISFFQHERFVHLLVTVFTGIISILFFLFGTLLENIMLILLFTITLCLFIPYILHYYKLENGVQKMYEQYWRLKEK